MDKRDEGGRVSRDLGKVGTARSWFKTTAHLGPALNKVI